MDLLHKVRILLIRRSSGNCTGIIKKNCLGPRYDDTTWGQLHIFSPPSFEIPVCFSAILQVSNPVRVRSVWTCAAAPLQIPSIRSCFRMPPPPCNSHRDLNGIWLRTKCNILVQCFCFISIVTFLGDPQHLLFATTYAALISIMNSSGVPGLMESAACNGARKYVARRNKCDRD